MGKVQCRVAVVVAGLAIASAASAKDPWPSAEFNAENRRICPRIELGALTDASLFEEVERYEARLSARRQGDIARAMRHNCANEWGGFTCESKTAIQRFDTWHLTPAFVAHLCSRFRHCEEPAAC
jgi:hypothetical protein